MSDNKKVSLKKSFIKKPKTLLLRFRIHLKIIKRKGYITFLLIIYGITEMILDWLILLAYYSLQELLILHRNLDEKNSQVCVWPILILFLLYFSSKWTQESFSLCLYVCIFSHPTTNHARFLCCFSLYFLFKRKKKKKQRLGGNPKYFTCF